MPHYVLADGSSVIYPESRSDADVVAFYNYWKSNYIAEAGTVEEHKLYRVRYGKVGTSDANVTVSEGMGYGMLISVMMAGPYDPDAQDIFNGLFRYTKAHPSTNDSRLMAWRQPKLPTQCDCAAFDGDADIALALVLANEQWGSSGDINYIKEARTVIAGIEENMIGQDSHLPMLGDWVGSNAEHYNQWTPRSSDFMFDNFRSFSFITADHAYWDSVITKSHMVINHIQSQYSPVTGLLPDFMQGTALNNIQPVFAPFPNGKNYFLEGVNDPDYYNAGRDPWRIGVDALLNKDSASLAEVRKMSNWMKNSTNGNTNNIHIGYHLNGNPIKSGSTTFFIAPFGVAAMTGGDAQQSWLNSIYNAVKAKHEKYYEDSVNLLSLLIMTGNYWGIDGKTPPPPPPAPVNYKLTIISSNQGFQIMDVSNGTESSGKLDYVDNGETQIYDKSHMVYGNQIKKIHEKNDLVLTWRGYGDNNYPIKSCPPFNFTANTNITINFNGSTNNGTCTVIQGTHTK